jgi:hypothetical protein
MKFDLKRPCLHCPFRTDRPGYLTAARAAEIIDSLTRDDWSWFGCHETTIPGEDEEGFSTRECGNGTQQCAGSLILLRKLNWLNVPSRIAIATGALDLGALDMSAPVVDTPEEFVTHHATAWEDKHEEC